jgi:outer membrane lipoprotein LolB
VRYQRNAAEESVHGNFSWQQTPGHTTVTLSSPLGQTLAIIDVTPERAVLRQAGQAPRSAADADALAADTLGWPLPIAGLRDWLQGYATDAQGQPWVARAGEASEVTTQDGWHISYLDWRDDEGAAYPRRIDLARDTSQAGPVAIRLVVDHVQAE